MKAHKITSGRNIMPQNCIELLQKCELCILNNLIEEPKYVHFKSFKCFVLFFFSSAEAKVTISNPPQTIFIQCTSTTLNSKWCKQWPFLSELFNDCLAITGVLTGNIEMWEWNVKNQTTCHVIRTLKIGLHDQNHAILSSVKVSEGTV